MSTQSQRGQGFILMIVWGGILMSCLIYAFVLYTIRGGMEPKALEALLKDGPEKTALLTPIFGVVSAVMFAGALLVVPKIFSAPQVLFTRSIVQFVLMDAIAIYGLVLGFLGASMLVFWGFWGASIVGLVLVMPSRRSREEMQGG